MRKPIALLTAAALAGTGASVATASAGDAEVRGAATKTVRVGDNFFSPKKITVKKRTIVKWVWGTDGETTTYQPHNVRGYKGNRFQSADKTEGVYRKRITKTTSIVCTIHATTMRMKVVVKR